MTRVLAAVCVVLGAALVVFGLATATADSSDATLGLSIWRGGIFAVPGALLVAAGVVLWRRR